jgi:hypothetical protein
MEKNSDPTTSKEAEVESRGAVYYLHVKFPGMTGIDTPALNNTGSSRVHNSKF